MNGSRDQSTLGRVRKRHGGFTLVELAVSLFIIALLLGSILVPLTTQVEQRQIGETQKTMDEIREALMGYAIANGNLPCPDLTAGAGANDGVEDRDGGTGVCQVLNGTVATGNLPWVTLGLGGQDAWGNRFRYTVLSNFSQRSPPFSIDTPASTLSVCSTSTPPCTGAAAITNAAVAVVVSHGNNGLGAVRAATNDVPIPASTADEQKNATGDLVTVSRVRSSVANSEFDDIVVWLPKFTLINRMVAAGKLP